LTIEGVEMVLKRLRRRVSLSIASVAAVALLLAPIATATDGFGPLAGPHGCLVAVGQGNASQGTSSCGAGKGLLGAHSVAVSPDGANVYVVGGTAGNSVSLSYGAIAILARDPSTGGITESSCISSDGTDGRDGASGACATEPSLLGASGVAVSPDGSTVYVTSASSASVVAFSRDPVTGVLTRLGCFQQTPRPGSPCAAANLLSGAGSPVVSADGSALYVAEPPEGALATLDSGLDLHTPAGIVPALPGATTTGAGAPGTKAPLAAASSTTPASLAGIFNTSLAGDELLNPCIAVNGLDGACAVGVATKGLGSLALSPEGKQLYATAPASNAIDTFTPESGGALAETGCLKQDAPSGLCRSAGLPLGQPAQLAASLDGKNVYAAGGLGTYGSSQIDVLSRDPSSGALSTSSCVQFSPKPEKPEAEEEESEEEAEAAAAPKRSAKGASASAADSACAPAPGLDNLGAVVVSGDGSAVYAIGSGAAAIFARNATSGQLTETSCAVDEDERCTSLPRLEGVTAAALSPDGHEIYVVASRSNAVMVFGIGAAVNSAHAAATRAGAAQVKVVCPAELHRACSGRVELTRAVAVGARRHGRRARVARLKAGGSGVFSITPGHAKNVRVQLTAGIRRRLADRRHLRLMAVVRAQPSAGGSGYGRHVTLRATRR
jgi:DNA-binding beta-propeller fold protein YncE